MDTIYLPFLNNEWLESLGAERSYSVTYADAARVLIFTL